MKRFSFFILVALMLSSMSAEVVLSITKTPFEAFTCSMDFTPVIGTDGITLISVTATNGLDATSVIIASSPAPAIIPSTDKISFRIQGGRAGETYIVSVKVADSMTGDKFEGNVNVAVIAN